MAEGNCKRVKSKNTEQQSMQRYLHVLEILANEPNGLSTVALVARLENEGFLQDIEPRSKARAVTRDLQKISKNEALTETKKGRATIWSLPSGALGLPSGKLSRDQALVLVMAYKQLGNFLPQSVHKSMEGFFQTALARNNRSENDGNRDFLERFAMVSCEPLLPPDINKDFLCIINQALYKQHQLTLRYRAASHGHEEKIYQLHPVCLVQREQHFSLFAVKDENVSKGEKTVQEFKLSRFVDLCPQPYDVVAPHLPTIKDVLAEKLHEYFPQEEITLTLRFADTPSGFQLCKSFEETRVSEDQIVREEDGRWFLTATVKETLALKWLLQRHAHRVEVLTPSSLREEMRNFVQCAAALYQDDLN